ncbi:AraC family transcriptional regulator [Acidocella sp.]|uniref:AraC family transcriptional regulator n=1 Tax=Acidocella sp. TaxID=50710 RepID=UPI002631D9D6|nr:AraC family transcriptional regulator [Acidocella sp.]
MPHRKTSAESVPMIRSSVVNQVISAILASPNGSAFLRRAHGMKSTRADLYERIALARYLKLFEDAAMQADDPLLGARMGIASPPGEILGPIGFLVLTSPRLRIGLENLAYYISAWQDATEIAIHDHGDTTIWSYRILDPDLWPRRQDSEFTLTATCSMIRNCFGGGWAPLEVHFEHPRPREWQALQAMFRAPLRFDQPANALVIDRNDLDKPTQGANAGFAPFLRRHVEDMMAKETTEVKLSEQVRQLVARDLGRAPVSLPLLAAELGLPARTLQRYLADEGTSVRDIVKALKVQEAKALLKTSRRHIGAVSQAVGYSDPTAFWRAFKSWEGVSPATFQRTKHRKG